MFKNNNSPIGLRMEPRLHWQLEVLSSHWGPLAICPNSISALLCQQCVTAWWDLCWPTSTGPAGQSSSAWSPNVSCFLPERTRSASLRHKGTTYDQQHTCRDNTSDFYLQFSLLHDITASASWGRNNGICSFFLLPHACCFLVEEGTQSLTLSCWSFAIVPCHSPTPW